LCDTLFNISAAAESSVGVYNWSSPAVGYVAGSGALTQSSTFFPILGIGEYFTPGLVSAHVTGAVVAFGVVTINAGDSAKAVTAYVYDATGTGGTPGNAIDSASTTLRAIATNVTDTLLTFFTFTHAATIPAGGFFIVVPMPQTAGDSLAVANSGGATGLGQGWLNLTSAGWLNYPSILAGDSAIDDFIIADICGAACPTITVTATQIGTTGSAHATSTGGVGPYTYSWSTGATTDTVTGLSTHTYTVTASDANGCTGTGSVSVVTGIVSIGDITDFIIYPNPHLS
jgi:hypothetical protein